MTVIKTGDIDTYYEIQGDGEPFIFIHGGFVSSTMWQPQVDHFSKNYKIVTYDIRGHGKTGGSPEKKYTIELFADDLLSLMNALNIDKAIICGLSLGGMVAQAFAARYPDRLNALILADTAAATALTKWDKVMLLCFPKWMMLGCLRLMGVKRFIRFSFWIAKYTRNKEWLGNKEIIEYEKSEMLTMDKKEYLKAFGSLYGFRLQELSRITVPTLILNGEHESATVFKHAEKIRSLILGCEVKIIAKAGHVSNLENTGVFNQEVEAFLISAGLDKKRDN